MNIMASLVAKAEQDTAATRSAAMSEKASADLIEGAETPVSALRFELIAFLLIVLTFAAVLLRGAIVDRHFTVGPATISRYSRYWYSDGDTQGTSSIGVDRTNSLGWWCDLTLAFANRYCGFGILLDVAHKGTGRDFSHYDRLSLDMDYHGPSRYLKIVLKNADPHYSNTSAGDSDKPNVIEFPVVSGRNHVELNLRDAAVEQWWINAHPRLPQAGKVQLDNIVAIDLQTGTGALPGRYDFALRGIAAAGAAVATEIWYLVLLGCWTGLAALYLAYRVTRMRRAHAARQRLLIEEKLLLQRARDAAESANQAKSRFLAHMSHELRTPLNAILGYAQILRACELSDRQNVAARTIQQSGEHLLALISDILDISRIEAGKLELAPRAVEPRAIVRSVADMIAVRAQEKGLAFRWDVAPDVPHCVIVDDKCLRQVLLNLLGNAVKFTSVGEVVLIVRLAASEGRMATLHFEVGDTGPGIPSDQLERIFEPFEQIATGTHHAGGTGLGLSISRHIVAAMQGDLTVESRPGQGSRFAFDIQLDVGNPAQLPPGPANDHGGTAAPTASRPVFSAIPAVAVMDRLLDFARSGNMRALRVEAEQLLAGDAALHPFGQHLLTLANAFQSRAILDLIEHYRAECSVA
jgi:signal transduction histidine kinase